MQAACQGRTQQQQGQQGEEAQQAGEQQGAHEQWDQQPPAGLQKPVVVLVGATLEEPLVEHAAQQVGCRDRFLWSGTGAALPPHRAPPFPLPTPLLRGQQRAKDGDCPALGPVSPGRRPPSCRPLRCPLQGWVRDPVTVRVGARMRIPSGLQVGRGQAGVLLGPPGWLHAMHVN